MIETIARDGHALVAFVRDAAKAHAVTWEMLVPNRFEVNLDAEEAEELAYTDMAIAKRALRDHICKVYGISFRELASLARP